MALTDFQFNFGGLTLGDATSFDVIGYAGLDDLPAVRTGDSQRSRDHGEWWGAVFMTGRDISMDIEVLGADDPTFRANVDALRAATVPGVVLPLTFQLPGLGNRLIFCDCRRRALPGDLSFKFRHSAGSLVFHATDPRIYDATLSSPSVGLPTGTGGVTWPAGWPVSWGSTSAGGSILVNNHGNWPTRPVVTISGPVDNPTIENLTAGKHLTFAITLATTDTLTIDLDAKSVLLNGTASRRSTMTADSQWWELAPGNSTVNYRANTTKVGSTATMAWRSAWV